MGGAKSRPRGHEADAFAQVGGFIATEIKVLADTPGMDGIAAAKAGHAGGTDQFFFWKLFQDAIDQQGLGFRVIKGFADDGFVGKQGLDVVFCHAGTAGDKIQIGIDLQKLGL